MFAFVCTALAILGAGEASRAGDEPKVQQGTQDKNSFDPPIAKPSDEGLKSHPVIPRARRAYGRTLRR